MKLSEVKRWARRTGISQSNLGEFYDDAFLLNISRLLQAIHREGHDKHSALRQSATGSWQLELGSGPIMTTPVSGPLPFQRIEVTGYPWIREGKKRKRLRTPAGFLAILKLCLGGSEILDRFEGLVSDFNNSLANLILNRSLGHLLDAESRAIERVYYGHHYYPFPALRLGPSLTQVVACSHLCRESIDLPLATVGPCHFYGPDFDNDHIKSFRVWAGCELEPGSDPLIPLHPWQVQLSPIVSEMIERRLMVLLDDRLNAVPLASQRTFRIEATGFDVKLPVDATLTGEHRLLYKLNCSNAPAVSALARILHERAGETALDFQYDVASLCHKQPAIGTHVSAIIRSPVRTRPGEIVVPALSIWCGPHQANIAALINSREEAYNFFRSYCRILMRGPVDLCINWGMALEPHMQNVHIALRQGKPSRVILRDLDSAILDPRRIRPLLREARLRFLPGTWEHMPSPEIGSRRLVHATMSGHLGEVMSYLARTWQADLDKLSDCVQATWSDLAELASSASARKMLAAMRSHTDSVKAMLRMRVMRSTRNEFTAIRPGNR